ncbi:hypothetical protein BB381_03510 [Campylobacter pinnipediorum subsp. caledonicus]|uniref:hypothetical protein n=1 Tax=Campylobacter pinnipediorum TaxID=1965231 RepID=UPI0009953346|nr:hypothetical protein [Campylobacter pinnipediorum]OPA71572.1 hypothetical protein BB381_03510 [Campylobacter pinnipediorum subsp. caledonicus]
MKIVFVFFAFLHFCLGTDFITKKEYAKMLYSNPRGIGCNLCHGQNGEGMVIAKYKTQDKKTKQLIPKELTSPSINDVEFDCFKNALKKTSLNFICKGVVKKTRSDSIMPSYFLTDDEIKILYEYVVNLKDKK